MDPAAKVVSFVVRFVYEEPAGKPEDRAIDWYAVIRHVQLDTEQRFVRWEEVVAFISQYVNLQQGRAE